MTNTFVKLTLAATLPLVLAGCISTTAGGGGTVVAAMATQGGIDPATGLRQFPTTISGGDGFQVDSNQDASFATLINSVRADAGAPALSYDGRLDAAAQLHSDDMFANGVLTHDGSTAATSDVGKRARLQGYNWTAIGENVAKGQPNENVAMNDGVKAPGHQRNNVDPAFRDFGLARRGTGADTYWTLVLGAE